MPRDSRGVRDRASKSFERGSNEGVEEPREWFERERQEASREPRDSGAASRGFERVGRMLRIHFRILRMVGVQMLVGVCFEAYSMIFGEKR